MKLRHRRGLWVVLLWMLLAAGCEPERPPMPKNVPADAPTAAAPAMPDQQPPSATPVAAPRPAAGGLTRRELAASDRIRVAEEDAYAGWPRVMLIQLMEVNTDSLGEPLGVVSVQASPPAFVYRDGVLTLDAAAAGSVDAALLASRRLTLGDASTPAEKCRVFVIHSIQFAGSGRVTMLQTYYALPALPLTLSVPAPVQDKALVVDPADPQRGDLLSAMLSMRAYPPAVKSIVLEENGGGVAVRAGESVVPVKSGELVSVFENRWTVRVSQQALTAASVRWEGAALKATPAEVVQSARDFGPVDFRTLVLVSCQANVPLMSGGKGGRP